MIFSFSRCTVYYIKKEDLMGKSSEKTSYNIPSNQTKSKDRIADFGEVYILDRIVFIEAMIRPMEIGE